MACKVMEKVGRGGKRSEGKKVMEREEMERRVREMGSKREKLTRDWKVRKEAGKKGKREEGKELMERE